MSSICPARAFCTNIAMPTVIAITLKTTKPHTSRIQSMLGRSSRSHFGWVSGKLERFLILNTSISTSKIVRVTKVR